MLRSLKYSPNIQSKLRATFLPTSLVRGLKKSGVVMALLATKPSGQAYPKLSPRTLPNGIANSPTVQRVSGDYVLQSSDVVLAETRANYVRVKTIALTNLSPCSAGSIDGKIVVNGWTEKTYAELETGSFNGSGFYDETDNALRFAFPLGTTLAQAQALLTGTVIRYQLATPIDTLNVPFTNPLIDLANSVGKNLCPAFAVQNLAIDGGIGIDVVVANAQTTMPIAVLPNTTYTMSGIPAYANRTVQRYKRADGSLISVTSTATATFTTPSECATVERYYYNGASGLQSVIISAQLELGNTATAYEPYKKNNALLQNFAATQTDGYTLEATVNSNGQAVGYDSYSPNGDFSNGITGYTPITGLGYSIALNEMTITNLTADAATYKLIYRTAGVTIGKRYYSRVIMKTNSNLDGLTIAGNSGSVIVKHSGGNNYELLSAIGTASATGIGDFRPLATSRTGDISANPIKIKEFMIINLTDNPLIQALETALGRQLTVAECDRIFPFVATTGTTLVSARDYIATEGLDSLGTIANNPSVDIVGTEDFAIAWCGITPSVIQGGYIIAKNLDTSIAMQYGLQILNGGDLGLVLSGNVFTIAPVGTIKSNTQTKIDIERKGGRLKCWINDILTYDQPNTTVLVTQPNIRVFARSSNAGGTTHAVFFKALTAYLILARGTYGDLSKLDGVLDKVARDYR